MSRSPAWQFVLALSVTLLLHTPAFAQGTADVVVEWNRILVSALATPGAHPPTVFVTRSAAMVRRDDVPFSITWTATTGPNITRSYNGFRQAADEEARSRALGGIHFTFDNLASFGVCTQLGEYAAANYLRKK